MVIRRHDGVGFHLHITLFDSKWPRDDGFDRRFYNQLMNTIYNVINRLVTLTRLQLNTAVIKKCT